MHDFTDFQSAKFQEICTQDVDLRGGESFLKHFWKFARKGSFSEKVNFCVKLVNDFRLQAAISAKWLQILESHDWLARLRNVGFPSVPLQLASHLYRCNQLKSFPWPADCIQETTFLDTAGAAAVMSHWVCDAVYWCVDGTAYTDSVPSCYGQAASVGRVGTVVGR